MLPKEPMKVPQNAREGEWQGRRALFYNNRIIVKFKPVPEGAETTAQELVESVRRAIPNGVLLRPPKATGRVLYGVDPATDVIALANELSQRPDVEYAEPDVIDHAAVVPSDPRYPDQWHLPKVNAPTAWDYVTGTTTGVLIGIIDSGISMSAAGALDHPDLNDAARYILGTDFVDGGTPRDLNGHGTHVAGIAAAESNNATGVTGMNWGTQVYICRTLDANGSGSASNFADAVEEIVDYAVAHGLKVAINYSGGGGASMVKQDACQYVNDHGMILCAAAGNDYGGAVIFPAGYSTMFTGVIAVGSTDSNDTVSDFSNVGPEVTVVAPGRGILSTMPTYAVGIPAALNYDYLDGTSMATPLVTGLVALMWSRHPSFANQRIRDCLTGTAVKLGAGTFDNAWGFGRVDALKAVRCGDLIFTTFTTFTSFTRFTSLTRFTSITSFTRLTALTRFTQLTSFTRLTTFTSLTRFTSFTSLTRFTRFTPFTPFTRFFTAVPSFSRFRPPEIPEIPDIRVRPFIRFANTVFSPQELQVERFEELSGAAEELRKAGLETVDEVAGSEPAHLAQALQYSLADAGRLVELAQAIMKRLIEGEG